VISALAIVVLASVRIPPPDGQVAQTRLKPSYPMDDTIRVGKTRIHCYGCSAVIRVNDRLPDQGLRMARWCNSDGETFCPSCAKKRGLEDPWGSQRPWAEYDHRRRDSGDCAAAARDTLPLGPAIEDLQTRSTLKRYGRRGWYWLIVGGATLLATIMFLGMQSSHAKELLRAGRHTLGLVESYGWLREGGYIRVRYVGGGELREGRIYVKERYEPGERVEVIYDSSNPSRIRTPQDANESPLATRAIIYGFVFGFMIFSAGIIILWRPHRWKRMLQTPWKPYAATYIPGRQRRAGPGIRLSSFDAPSDQEVSLRLNGTLRRRATKLAGETVVWAAGDLTSRVVLAIPSSRELFAAERPRGYTGRKWLEAQKGPSKRERRAARVYTGLIGGLSGTMAIVLVSHQQWLLALLCGGNAALLLRVSVRLRNKGVTLAGGAASQRSSNPSQ
jgi:hypothetical protein